MPIFTFCQYSYSVSFVLLPVLFPFSLASLNTYNPTSITYSQIPIPSFVSTSLLPIRRSAAMFIPHYSKQCTACGAMDDHTTYLCPTVCFYCNKKKRENEKYGHSIRECPYLSTCGECGLKGHELNCSQRPQNRSQRTPRDGGLWFSGAPGQSANQGQRGGRPPRVADTTASGPQGFSVGLICLYHILTLTNPSSTRGRTQK